MPLIKKKSLVVALMSSIVIIIVLVLTIVGYLVYIQLREERLKGIYGEQLQKVKARVYARNIDVSKLAARIETDGSQKGRPVVEGVVTNRGAQHISDLVVKIKFLDRDGTTAYQVITTPQEPALGSVGLGRIAIPYVYTPAKHILKSGDSIIFRQPLFNCPQELYVSLRDGISFAKKKYRWSGNLDYEVLSLDY